MFLWYDEPVQGTKMEILKADKTVSDYGLTKNSVLYLKYRCRESKYWKLSLQGQNDKYLTS